MKRILALIFTLAMVLSSLPFVVSAAGSTAATEGAPSSFALLDGASVRLDAEHSGIRFETRILISEYLALGDDVVIGTVIIPTDLVNGEITVSSPNAVVLTSETVGVTSDGDEAVFYAAIVDVLPQNYARKFSARSFIKVGDKYYYTAYSDANNSRSIYEVAVDAWEGSYKDNAIVKAYLDKVVVINGSMLQSKTIKGYTSPYNVSYANDTITVTATDGTLVEGDIATMIVDYNGRIFTRGWTVENNTLTAPYKASLNAVETFDEISISESVGEINNTSIWWRAFSTNHKNTKKKVSNGVLQLMKYDKEEGWPKLHLKGNVAEALGDTNDTLTVSFSVKAPEGRGVPRMILKLCKDNNNTNAIALNLAIRDNWLYYGNSDKAAPTDAGKIAAITNTDWVDITLRFDFVTSTMSVYVNGEYHSSTTVSGMNLTYAKTYMTSYALRMDWTPMSYPNIQGICFDSFSWGVSKSN